MTKYLQNFPASRLRRNRQSQWIRNLVSENSLSVNDLIWPVFICDGNNIKEEIASMPGVFKYSIDRLNEVIDQAVDNKINLIALFPNTPNDKKDKNGSEALNEDNLVCKALRKIKNQTLDLGIMCDVALDPYTSHGHDGLLSDTNQILNDESNEVLVKQSLLLADHKADIIAPSDMMDGRIGLIRNALENSNFKDTLLLSYAAKYASSFYGPFRDAVGSKGLLKGDKKNYQMDFRNSDEAIREVALDIKEGADMVMVKPGMPYLDIIKTVKDNFKIPVLAYQVSGEYSLLSNSIKKGLIDKNSVLESLISFKRAGANAIVSYYADRISDLIK